MKSNRALKLFVVGLAIVGICINVEVGIATAYARSSGGLQEFIVDRLIGTIVGANFSLDIFFDPVGYLLMIVGIMNLRDKIIKPKIIIGALLVGMMCSLVFTFAPLFISSGIVYIKTMVAVYIAEGIAFLVALTRFVNEVKAKVDSYYNMEVGKDLVFATELFFFAYFVILIVVFASAIGIYFADILLILNYTAMIYSVLYFVYKTIRYNNQLKFFE